MTYTLEVCVDSVASALAAKLGGADRLELCADLIIGGTTPSPALLRQVKAETGLPVRALLRPRFGDFCYDRYELAQMEQSAAELVEAGADGIVTGVLTPDGALDVDALRPIYAAARRAAAAAGRPVACTLHRAFDVCRVLDEHTAALDPATAEKVLALTKKIVAENHITCLMITHNIPSALSLGNRTIMMNNGRIALELAGAERENMTTEQLLKVFHEQGVSNDRILFSAES